MTLTSRRSRAILAALCLAALAAAAAQSACAQAAAEPDTSKLTPLQRVMLKARQQGATTPTPAAEPDTLPAGVRRLTSTAVDEGACDWSPDGKTLYYDTLDAGRRSLMRLDMVTGEASPIADPPREGFNPAISPDGRFIVFARNLPQIQHKLWVMRLEDGEEAKLTNDGSSLHEGDPAWSLSGGTIFFSQSNNGTPHAKPMQIARTGENMQELEQGTGSYQDPAPSPSGAKIAWVIRLGTAGFLRIVDARISALSEDFEFPGYFLSAADWLPGERRLVVSYLDLNAPRDGYRLGIVDLDAGKLKPWLDLNAALDPRVSPDGRQVAFRARRGGSYELFLADLP